MIKLNAFFKSFGPKKVLRSLDLEVKDGEIVTLVGNNGSGKTTLLRSINTLDRPDDYDVAEIDGYDLRSFPEEIRSRIGYLPHNPAFYPELTGFENLRFWLELNSIRDAESKARGFLAKVGLISFGDDLSGNYSRGMVQRLGFAMAISHTPTTLLLDEPFTGLDSDGIAIIENLLTKLRDENCSIILVSHESPSYSDRTVELDRGGIS
ncbi:MAG: ABC transporter ATP-binding protein [Candidatus Poseidoniia archaeon]|jgi:ABC-type multidrug transport system ATPase subunit|nr:ABC transporter ATP-binding protein [Candidatus Poseidoniia archaeon]|tara:strand:- start:1103 stop:1726 length:624 start_codon:yes stop_codon:yes gene_type:complete